MKLLISLLALSLIITACNIPPSSDYQYSGANGLFKSNTEAQEASIHTNFSKHFMIGTAVSAKQILGSDRSTLDLVKKEFNAITPENVMKWELIHPKPNVYEFKAADALVDFAEQNDIFLVGHTLVWHHMTPDWIFKDDAGKYVSREVLLGRLEEHINTVAGRYKNRVDAWDVVNEALNDDGSLRESNWLKIIGEDYIEIALSLIHI